MNSCDDAFQIWFLLLLLLLLPKKKKKSQNQKQHHLQMNCWILYDDDLKFLLQSDEKIAI